MTYCNEKGMACEYSSLNGKCTLSSCRKELFTPDGPRVVGHQAPVSFSPVFAEWIEPIWDSDWHSMTATCSHCRERGEVRFKRNLQNVLIIDSPRCPECGAFMK